MLEPSRLTTAVYEAEEAFWAEIAAHFPEIKTGDLCPFESFNFSQAAHKAVNSWVDTNRRTDD